MSTTANKTLVIDYLRHLERGDADSAFALAADDAVFWLPATGVMSRDKMYAFFKPVTEMVESMKFTIRRATAEEDRVALEVSGQARLKNGRDYANEYHFLFVVRDGRIIEVKEYADTAPAVAAFVN